jgi:dTDP-4-dehydrorhamnose reductase
MNSKNDCIAVFGSNGQLGTELLRSLRARQSANVIALNHSDADNTDAEAIRRVLNASQPQVVINCAAYVRVDDCEDHADEAFAVNAIGAFNISRACAELSAFCIYISTDYVFDGSKSTAYLESDPTCPINVYGASKLAGEFLTRQRVEESLIIRTASLFGNAGARGKSSNFTETILRKARAGEPLRIVNDVRMSPTYARDAADGIVALLAMGAKGIVHLFNDGSCTWYEFAKTALELTGIYAPIEAISVEEYGSRARRPKNSSLQSERSLVRLRSWPDGLKAYLTEKGYVAEGPAIYNYER